LSTFVDGRQLDDNAQVLLRYANGARGALWASQVAPGNENNLRLRVYGAKGGLEWRQEHPNQLHWSPFGQATQIIARGTGAVGVAAARVTRIPSGHPEGYLEAFGTLYSEVAQAIRSRRAGGHALDAAVQFPTVVDGVHGVVFVETVVASSRAGSVWMALS
jgi:predicted dehydrogenase